MQGSAFSARQALVASLDEGTGGTDNDDVASSISWSPSVTMCNLAFVSPDALEEASTG